MHTRSERIYRMYVSHTYHIHALRPWTCYCRCWCCCCHHRTIHCWNRYGLVDTHNHYKYVLFSSFIYCVSAGSVFFFIASEWLTGWQRELCRKKCIFFFIVILDRKVNHILSKDTCDVNGFCFAHCDFITCVNFISAYSPIPSIAVMQYNSIHFYFVSFDVRPCLCVCGTFFFRSVLFFPLNHWLH